MVGYIRLQGVGANRQADPGHPGDAGYVAADGAHDRFGVHRPVVGHHPDHPVALFEQVDDFGALMNVHPAFVGSFCQGPVNPVVAGGGRLGVIGRAKNRPLPATGQIHFGSDFIDFFGGDIDGFGPKGGVDLGPGFFLPHVGLGMGHPQNSLLLVHHPAIGFFFQPLIQLNAALVKFDRFRDAVVGPNDGGVTAGVAAADVFAFQNGHVGDVVPGGQMIGGR